MIDFQKNKRILLILSSPSGGGKSSLAKALLEKDSNLRLSISATTRPPRQLEVDGRDYYFKTKDEFEQLIHQNMFLEYAKIYDNYYGTLKESVTETVKNGYDLIFDIDWHGARSIKDFYPDAVSVFIKPPDFDILKKRLEKRGQDSLEVIQNRMKLAQEEISHASEYDYVIVNDDFNQSLNELTLILMNLRNA